MFIAFEGIDGSGKDTQINLLREKIKFDYFKYPTRTFGLIGDYLEKKIQLSLNSVFHLFLADIMNEQESLSKSKFAVVDRYIFSTIAHETDGISYENAKKIVTASGFLKPKMVIYLDITPEISQERKRKQKVLDRYEENKEYLADVRKNFLKLYRDKFLTENWHLVDASKNINEVHLQILEILRNVGIKH